MKEIPQSDAIHLVKLLDGIAEVAEGNDTYKNKVDLITDLLVNDSVWPDLSCEQAGEDD